MRLSIIIVSYNTKALLQQLLGSIKASRDKLTKEIIVVDNGSTDGSDKLATIKNNHNLGFAAANNQGIKRATGDYILLLNSDTKIFPNTLSTMIKFMDRHPRVGVATCKVILPDGHIDPASHRGFPTPWAAFTYFVGLAKLFPTARLFAQYHQGWKDLNTAHEIDSPSGAFYLVRRPALDQVGLLDERFFMYAEDLDWSLRFKQAGWTIMYVPTAKIIHFKKSSGRGSTDSSLRRQASSHFFDTMQLFYDKHYQYKYPALIRWLILAGIWIISKFKS